MKTMKTTMKTAISTMKTTMKTMKITSTGKSDFGEAAKTGEIVISLDLAMISRNI